MYIELSTGILEVDSNELLIPLSFALFDMKDFSARKGATTKTIKIPATDNNRKLLGFQDLPYSTTFLNNQFITARVRDEGTIYLDGHLQFLNATKKVYECVIVGTNADWSTRLRQFKLNELDLSEADHQYNYTTIQSSWENTEKYVYPFIDYGILKNKSSVFTIYDFKPAIRYAYLIEQIFKKIGYRVGGTFLSEIPDVMLPFGLDNMKTDTTKNWAFQTVGSGSLGTQIATSEIRIDTLTLGTGNVTLTANNRITPLNNVKHIVKLSGSFENQTAGSYRFRVFASKEDVITQIVTTNNYFINDSLGERFLTLTLPPFIFDSDEITHYKLRVVVQRNLGGEVWQDGAFAVTIKNLIITTEIVDEVLRDGLVEMSKQMPDINCLEFLTDIKDFYNLYFYTDVNTGTVTVDTRVNFFKSLNLAIDWTNKEDLSKDTVVSYLSENTPKLLRYTFAKDENDGYVKAIEESNNINFGSGTFQFDNVFTTEERVQSLKHIAPSYTVGVDDGNAQTRFGFISEHIRIHKGDGGIVPDFATLSKPRIALFLGKKAVEGTFDFEGASQTHYPCMVSYNDENNLLFGDFETIGHVKRYYNGENTQRNNAKVVTKYFYLNKADIANLDMRYPVKIDNEFYFVNKVIDWTPRSVTKVELVTITDYQVELNLTPKEIKKASVVGNQLAKFELSIGFDNNGNFVIVDKGEPLITLDKTFNTFTFGQAQVRDLKTNIAVPGTSITVQLYTMIAGVKVPMKTSSF
jgi:hypothetical protein